MSDIVLFDRVRVVAVGDMSEVSGFTPGDYEVGDIGVVTCTYKLGVDVEWEQRRFDDERESNRCKYLWYIEIERVQP